MFDSSALQAALAEGAGIDAGALEQTHPALFSRAELEIAPQVRAALDELVAAVESVVALPAWQASVLSRAPAAARSPVTARGVFFGYDVHLTTDGPRLIEINTNAGGALLNTCLLRAHGESAVADAVEQAIVAMFREEWRLAAGDDPLRRIAIVDENPAAQYLAPEFALFRRLFERHGIAAVIADPGELVFAEGRLRLDGAAIDLVYNRLTDFALDMPASAALRAALDSGAAVITPHPRAHALYADKRNLMLLSDEASLLELGVPAATRAVLLAGVPRTVAVTPAAADDFWAGRKNWFFKPAAGFGSRAAYRGDKLTKRVFEEILQGAYIAQQIVPPSELPVTVGAGTENMKLDLRCYAYAGRIQLLAARLYQGQTTNFRTPGGGFAPVFVA